MLPALKPGEGVLCFNWAYIFKKPKIGDIVVVKMDDKYLVKRIRKLDGSRIFVVGDNSKMSTDSRQFGWVSKLQIAGKIVWYLN